MKINYYINDDVKFVFINIISIIVSIEIVSFDFILKSFVSIIIIKVENVIHHSFVFFFEVSINLRASDIWLLTKSFESFLSRLKWKMI